MIKLQIKFYGYDYLQFYHYLFTFISNATDYITVILDNLLIYRVTTSDAA
jgi:hypothetical protein